MQAQDAERANVAFQEASNTTQELLFEAHTNASAKLAAPQSSALVVFPAALNLHWKLAEACKRTEWKAMPLPGSELANLNQMLGAGWSQKRRLEDKVDIQVELIPEGVSVNSILASLHPNLQLPPDAGSTQAGLRLAALRKRPI